MSNMQSEALNKLANQRWQSLLEHEHFDAIWLTHQTSIQHAIALSDFIYEQCLKQPQMLTLFLPTVSQPIVKSHFSQKLNQTLHQQLSALTDEIALKHSLRRFRNWQMVEIAWRDVLNKQSIEDSLVQVSELANQLIVQTSDWLYHKLSERYGVPQGTFGPQPLLIIGMGKLGGMELNFSSDIDLIFTFPHHGMTQGGRQSIEHQQFFTKLAQALINALHQPTADGQVFRVDMRLRPFGDSGPLVMHLDAIEDYYQEQGREWERYALLKGRILNSPCQYSRELQQVLQPFIFRRYLDFSAIESLRDMKALIQQEVRRRGLVNNIKLGQGGIREAEFIVQSLQLIRGGRESSLQIQSLLQALQNLVTLEVMPAEEANTIRNSYLWLRKVEHCLQQFNDKQTQVLPDKPLDQARLLQILNLSTYSEFITQLKNHTDYIHAQFLHLIGEEEAQAPQAFSRKAQLAQDIWHLDFQLEEFQTLLKSKLNEQESPHFHALLADFKLNLESSRVGQRGLNTLNQLMPLLIERVLENPEPLPSERLERVITVLIAILGRTAYLELLLANQGALKQLVSLCNASPWLTQQLARFPLLLDELINPATLYNPTPLHDYPNELRRSLLRIEPEDLELQMEALRQFKLSEQLRIAAADIASAIPLMKVSDHLTSLAESIVSYVVDLAWNQLTSKYGEPFCETKGSRSMADKSFAVIAYGKFGGWELGYGSDLDLVFVHNCEGNKPTNGEKPIESRQFYFKLAQRILHIFTTKTGLGMLYEVDMRLRPSGQSGVLVCHFNGYASYQQSEAWTWEHQALCRARFIYGDADLQQEFKQLRLSILAQKRAFSELKKEVVEMREKMRLHLAKGDQSHFDLKQDLGGIADIEFIVQFLTLAYCQLCPAIAQWTDNVRVLESLVQAEVIEASDAEHLKAAYLNFRHQSHRLTLQNKARVQKNDELRVLQQSVQAVWQKIMH